MAVNVLGGPLEFTAVIDDSGYDQALKNMEKGLVASLQRQQEAQRRVNKEMEAYSRAILGAANSAKNIQGLDKEIQKINNEFTETENLVKKIAVVLAGYASFNAFGSFVRDIIKVRGEFQQLEVAFTTMLRSKEAADRLLAQAIGLAAKTPFGLSEVGSGAKQLLAYGFAADEVVDTLRRLGDIAAGVGAPLNDIAFVYGTLRVQGRAYAQDIRQFTQRGIPVIQELAKQFNKTEQEVNEMVSAGKVGFPEIEKAFKNLTSEGGIFFNLMEEQSKTLTGQIANLQDAWDVMLNNIGKSNEGILSGAIRVLTELVENYETVLDILKVLIITYGSYRAAIIATNVVTAVSTALTKGQTVAELLRAQAIQISERAMKLLNATMLRNPAVAVTTGIAALVATMVVFGKTSRSVASAQDLLNKAQEKSTEAYAQQEAKIKPYLELVKKGNLTEQQRIDIYNKLAEVDKKIVEGLDAKSLSYDNLKNSVDRYLDSLRKQLAAEANQEAIAESIKREQALQKQIDKTQQRIESLKKELETARDSESRGLIQFSIIESETNIKAITARLEEQKKVTQELGQAGADLAKDTADSAKAAARTVKVIEDEIKALKDRRDEVSATSTQYKEFTNQIRTLEKELEAITGKIAEKGLSKREQQLKQLLEAIADAERDALQSGLQKEQSEIDKINEQYDELIKRAKELDASEGIIRRIENARTTQIGNTTQKQQADDYRKFIEQQRELFNQFEQYKLQVGREKARELVDYQTAEYDSFIEFLKVQLALVRQDSTLLGRIKTEFLAAEITKAEKDRAKKDADEVVKELERLQKETETFNMARVRLEEEYLRNVQLLRSQYSGEELEERLSALKNAHQEELDQLKLEFLKQSDIYKKLNADITFYSRERLKQLQKELEKYLKDNPGLPPVLKKQIEDAIEAIKKLRKETTQLFNTGQKLLDISDVTATLSGSFDELASSLEGTNDELADMIRELSGVMEIAGDAINAIGQFATGNIVGGIQSAISAIAGIFNAGKRAREERLRRQRELEEFNTRLYVGEQEINALYRERLRDQIRLNQLRVEGLEKERELLLKQKDEVAKQFETVFTELQGQTAKVIQSTFVLSPSFLASETYKWLRRMGKTMEEIAREFGTEVQKIVDVPLAGLSFDELEELFLKGQLEGKARELFELLQKIKQEGVDVDRLLAENADQFRQTLTGTTADNIADSIIEGFRSGLRSASDFADNFQQLMQNALLQALKFQTLEGPLKEFYEQFAADAESDGILSEAEIQQLRARFNAIIENAGDKFQELQQITNMPITTAGGNSLSGAIRGMTADQADLLAGQFGGLRITAIEQLNVAQQGLRSLQNIESYTANLIEVRAILARFELQGIKIR